METPNLKFTFGEDSNLLATGKKPKAPSGPVNSVTTKFTFGQSRVLLFFQEVHHSASSENDDCTAPTGARARKSARGSASSSSQW